MNINLYKPHTKQKDLIKALLDPNIFQVVAVIGRQWGKTMTAMNMAMYWAFNKPNSIIYWVSPTNSQADKIYKDIINAIIDSKTIKSKKGAKGDTEIVFINKSKIIFRSAETGDSLRGPSVDYMILDEAAFIRKETFEVILSPMLLVRGKKLFICSTPKGKNWMFDKFINIGNEPSWKSFRYSSYDSPYVNDNIIGMLRRTLPEKLFSQEVEAEFVDSASVFNNINDIMILDKQITPIPGEKYYGGIDIGLLNDASVLSILDSNGNLVNYYRWEKVESPDLIAEIVNISKQWNFTALYIELNNQGLTIFQDLKRKVRTIEGFTTTSKTKPEIINRLIHLFNMKEMLLIKDETFRIELEAFIFKQNDSNTIKFMADSGFHDDCVMSLAIARSCYDDKVNKINVKRVGFF